MGITTTTNLNLEKPDGNEFKLREFHNDNMDILDEAVGDKPQVAIFNSANISIPSSTSATTLSFDSVRYDNKSQYSAGTPTQLTCQEAGVYMINAVIRFDANATQWRLLAIAVNGTREASQRLLANASFTEITITAIVKLAVSDAVTVEVGQLSGGNLDIVRAANYSPELRMVKVA